MKAIRVVSTCLVLFGVAFMAACDLDYLNGALTSSTAASEFHYTWNTDRTIKWCLNAQEAIVWYEKYQYDAAGRVIQEQRYNPANVLQWSYLRQFDSQRTVEAYFNASDALVWYTVCRFDTSGMLTGTENYDGTGVLQYLAVTAWTGTNKTQETRYSGNPLALEWAVTYSYNADGKLTEQKNYGADGRLTGRLVHNWDSQGREIRQEGYGAQGLPAAARAGGAPAARPLAAAPRALALPDVPAAAVAPAATLTDLTLAVAWTRNWRYDEHGWFALAAGADYYPLNLVRSDDRLAGKLDTTLTWEQVGSYEGVPIKRITEKKTKYGNDVALDLKLGYDNWGWPNRLGLSGRAMLIPLDLTMAYNDDHTPKSLAAAQGDTPLYRLDFEYRTDVTITVAPPSNPWYSIDPFNFTPSILKAVRNYDGDGRELGKFTFDYDFDGQGGTRVNSLKALGNGQYSDNGRFELTFDLTAKKSFLTSYGPANNVVWHYEYGLDDALNRISEAKFDANGAIQAIESLDIATLFR
jgi:hypothetical protein